jgi:thiol-disulfide isomerase/thioredoxin
MIQKTSLLGALFLFLISFSAYSQGLNPGPWRFELKTQHGTIPFIIDIKKNNDDYKGILHNGQEEIALNDIKVEKGQVTIPLQTYEITMELSRQKKGRLAGYLIRHNKNPKTKIPVIATFGVNERFQEKGLKPTIELTGRWAVTLTDEQNKKDTGIVIFKQQENQLTGTILTPTGDFRYFAGFISENEFTTASFDGVYNYLFKGEVVNGQLKARLLSNYKTTIEGIRNEKAELPDAYLQTQLKSLQFLFPDLDGNLISLKDQKFKNRPVIVQLFGSWCPNCLDEMNYLIPWYKKNQKRGVEIIALAFERSLSPEDAKKQLKKTQAKFNIPYTLLIAGSTSEDRPKDKIKEVVNFISFPTTIFLNRDHKVIKVHAGFTGPSTGEFYERWKTEFNQTVNELLKK